MRKKKRLRLNEHLPPVVEAEAGTYSQTPDDRAAFLAAIDALPDRAQPDLPDRTGLRVADDGATFDNVDVTPTPTLADQLVARAEQSRARVVPSLAGDVNGLVYIGDAILALCERLAEHE